MLPGGWVGAAADRPVSTNQGGRDRGVLDVPGVLRVRRSRRLGRRSRLRPTVHVPVLRGPARRFSRGGLSDTQTPASLELTPEVFDARMAAEEPASGMPEAIGRFQVRELLGGGGFGLRLSRI